MRGIHRWSVDSPHKGPVIGKVFPCCDVIMRSFSTALWKWASPVSMPLSISYLISKILTHYVLTHWGWDKMAAISQTTLSNPFSWMKIFQFRIKFDWSLFLRFQLTIFQHWFRWWLGAGQATSHYLNQWWSVYWPGFIATGFFKFPWHFPDISLTDYGFPWQNIRTKSWMTGFKGHISKWVTPGKDDVNKTILSP